MSVINIPLLAPNPIHTHRWCDNGKYPNVHLYALMAQHLNKVGRWQPKEHFRSLGQQGYTAAGGAGDRVRWRFAGHSGLFANGLRVRMSAALSSGSTTPKIRAKVDGGNQVEYSFGAYAGTPVDCLDELGHFEAVIPLAADTDFTFTFTDVDGGRLVSASVCDNPFLPDTTYGYVNQDYAINQMILDADRQGLAELAYNLWRINGNSMFNWTSDQDSAKFTRTSATAINLIDGTSTTVSANTPGFVLDDRYMDLVAGGAVFPCVVKVYGKTAAAGGGQVLIKDSGGATVATVNLNSATLGYFSTTWNAPATKAKFDVQVKSDGTNQVEVYAVCVYPKG